MGNIATLLEILQPLLDLEIFVGNIATNFRQVFFCNFMCFIAWVSPDDLLREHAGHYGLFRSPDLPIDWANLVKSIHVETCFGEEVTF